MNTSKPSSNHSSEENPSTTFCVACKEIIKSGAIICPHCRSPQSPSRWRIAGSSIKWLGGITAIVTLIIGMIQINSLFQNWREQQKAVRELVQAAKIQSNSGDYEGAWQLIDDAIKLEPGSTIARNTQIQLAMVWLRNISFRKNQNITEKINMLLPVLYRGVASSNHDIAADAFAHLGWADILRYREGMISLNVDSHFMHSLEINDENVYAHAMWAYWMLLPEAKNKYGEDRLAKAQDHFQIALNTGQKRDYIRSLQIRALLDTDAMDDEVAEVETIKLANNLRINHESLSVGIRLELLETYRILLFEGEHDRAIRLTKLLFSAMSPDDLLDTFLWLSKDIDYFNVKPMYYDISVYKFIVARLTEHAGDLQKALSLYLALQSEIEESTKMHSRIEKAMIRINQHNN